MKTDRELLELAAKAVGGMKIHPMMPGKFASNHKTEKYNDGRVSFEMPCKWDPISDDGDALRLAVKLGMRVYVYAEDLVTTVGFNLPSGARKSIHHPHGVDAYAAARLAIVRAAAAIGEAM